jgi:toxin ParE1/3/4
VSALVLRRPDAREDLAEIFAYLGRHDPRIGDRFLRAVDATLELLASMPGIGSPVKLQNPRLVGLRRASVKSFRKYQVYYLTTDHGIEVVRVLHGSRDVKSILESQR